MQPATIESIAVEYCRSCTGIFLDQGELEQLADQELRFRSHVTERPLEISCARCSKRVPMMEAVHEEGTGALLCETCGKKPEPKEDAYLGEKPVPHPPPKPGLLAEGTLFSIVVDLLLELVDDVHK